MRDKYILFFLFSIGLGLRLWGIGFGLPGLYGPSSEGIIVRNALSFGTGNPVPLFSTYGPISSYILLFFYGIYFIIGYITGLFLTIEDFAIQYFKDPTVFYLLGRSINALLSTISIYLTYSMCSKYASNKFALLAAGIITFLYLPIAAGHIIMADNLCMLLNLLVMINVITFYKTLNIKNLLLSAFFAALSTLTKYYSILIFLPIIIVLLFAYIENKVNIIKIIAQLLLVTLGTIILFAPFIFYDFSIFIQDILMVLKVNMNSSSTFFSSFNSYIMFLISGWGLGVVFFVFCIFGIIISLKSMEREKIILLSFPLLFIIYLSLNRYMARWLLQIIPMLIVFCIIGIDYFNSHIKKDLKRKYLTNAVLFLGFLFVMPSVYSFTNLINKDDTRKIAYDWINENIDESANIVLDSHCPPIRSNNISLIEQWNISRTQQSKERLNNDVNLSKTRDKMMKMKLAANESFIGKKYYVFNIFHDFYNLKNEEGKSVSPYRVGADNYSKFDISWYKSNGYNYLITSSFIYQRYIDQIRPKNKNIKGFYRELFSKCELIKEIHPYKIDEWAGLKIISYADIFNFHENCFRPGPVIRVYKLN